MDQTIFCENLKKFRLSKNYTQEQVANHLNVNVQTVSRWECGTTLPDVLTLPVLARLYGVTVDVFYKRNSVAYNNYAQRLTAVYEKTRKPEDFIHCLLEYKKLMHGGVLSVEDKWNYAIIHQWMFEYCKNTAMEWYDTILKEGSDFDENSFYRACACRISFLFAVGKGEEAYECFLKAVEKFPDAWELYIHGGEVCGKLEKYDEAIQYFDRAGAIGTPFYDELYCKAMLYEKIGKDRDAYKLYQEIAEKLRKNGFDVEADMAEESAKRLDMKKK